MIVKAEIKPNSWAYSLDCARVTIWKNRLNKDTPSVEYKRRMIASEHSPLREVVFVVDIEGIKSWVSVHLVRHFMGVEKYVSTQRTDRKESSVPRDKQQQGALVNMRLVLNAQALINISQSRLCWCASKETVQVWRAVAREISKIDTLVGESMVPKCIYRGFCPEGEKAKSECKYTNKALRAMRDRYLNTFAEKNCTF
jgi:hypothetical protein